MGCCCSTGSLKFRFFFFVIHSLHSLFIFYCSLSSDSSHLIFFHFDFGVDRSVVFNIKPTMSIYVFIDISFFLLLCCLFHLFFCHCLKWRESILNVKWFLQMNKIDEYTNDKQRIWREGERERQKKHLRTIHCLQTDPTPDAMTKLLVG